MCRKCARKWRTPVYVSVPILEYLILYLIPDFTTRLMSTVHCGVDCFTVWSISKLCNGLHCGSTTKSLPYLNQPVYCPRPWAKTIITPCTLLILIMKTRIFVSNYSEEILLIRILRNSEYSLNVPNATVIWTVRLTNKWASLAQWIV